MTNSEMGERMDAFTGTIGAEERSGQEALDTLIDVAANELERQRAVQRLQEALVHPCVRPFLRAVFTARAFTQREREQLERALPLVREAREPAAFHLLNRMLSQQGCIRDICGAFDELPSRLFAQGEATGSVETDGHRFEIRILLVHAGAFREFVDLHGSTRASVASAAACVLVKPELRRSPKGVAVLMAWVDRLQQAPLRDQADARAEAEERSSRELRDGYGIDELNHINRAYDEEPPPIFPSVTRANLHLSLRQPSDALEDFDWLLAKKPNDLDARFGRARTLLMLGRPAEALPEYEQGLQQYAQRIAKTISNAPSFDRWSYAQVRAGRAACLLAVGRAEEAEREYLALSQECPDEFAHLVGRARALTALERPEEALAVLRPVPYRRYRDSRDHSWRLHAVRAAALHRLGHLEAARAIRDLGARYAPADERAAFQTVGEGT